MRQTGWLWRHFAPRLFIGYLNEPDEIDHTMLCLTHPATPGVPADLNASDWKNGVTPESGREKTIDEVQGVLRAVKNPVTGEHIFRSFARPPAGGVKYGIGGPTGGDLYYGLAPGYSFSNVGTGPLFTTGKVPMGNHGFLPARADMLAICISAGPRLPHNTRWSTLHGIDIAPLITDLLSIYPPAQATGGSPLGLRE